jgi:hypothetical protein
MFISMLWCWFNRVNIYIYIWSLYHVWWCCGVTCVCVFRCSVVVVLICVVRSLITRSAASRGSVHRSLQVVARSFVDEWNVREENRNLIYVPSN